MFQKNESGRRGHAQEKSLMRLCSVASFTEIKLATKVIKIQKILLMHILFVQCII